MAIELSEFSNKPSEKRLTMDELDALIDEYGDDAWNMISVKSYGDETYNSAGELSINVTPQQDKFNLPEPELSLNEPASSSAYPVKMTNQQEFNSLSDEEKFNTAEREWTGLANSSGAQTIMTPDGEVITFSDPTDRAVLYYGEDGTPYYSAQQGDYVQGLYGKPTEYNSDYYGHPANAGSAAGNMLGGLGSLGGAAGSLFGSSQNGNVNSATGEVASAEGDTRLENAGSTVSHQSVYEELPRIINECLVKKAKWRENPVDQFTTYTYIIKWFTIDSDSFKTFTKTDDKRTFINHIQTQPDKCYTIYQTGIDSTFNLSNLELKSYYGSNNQYKNLIFSEIQMQITEPSGASLLEILREVAQKFKYLSIASIPYFMTINYVGYVGDGSDRDGLQESLSDYETFVAFYINALQPRIRLDTQYFISGCAFTSAMYVKETFKLKNDIKISIRSGATLSEIAQEVGKELNKQYILSTSDSTQEIYKNAENRDYYKYPQDQIYGTAIKIDVEKDIANVPLNTSKVKSQSPEVTNDGKAVTMHFASGTSFNTIFNEIEKIIDLARISNSNFTQGVENVSPEEWFDLCQTLAFTSNQTMLDYDTYTNSPVYSYQYKLFKKFNPNFVPPFDMIDDKDKEIQYKAQYRKMLCECILENNGLVKRYDYVNTGMNDQILDVNLDMDYLFAVSIPDSGLKSPSASVKAEVEEATPYNDTKASNFAKTLDDILNQNKNMSGIPPQFTPVKYYDYSASSDSTNGSDQVKNSIFREIFKSGGMLQLKLHVKGDPYWISDEAIFADQKEKRNLFAAYKLGLLHLYFEVVLPRVTQDYHNDPLDSNNVNNGIVNKTISGVYQVISVTSTFSNGKFTQVIDCVLNCNLPLEYNGEILNEEAMKSVQQSLGSSTNVYNTSSANGNPIASNDSIFKAQSPSSNLKKTELGVSPLPEDSYQISSKFGPRNIQDQVPGASTMHNGVDLAAKAGTPIYSAADGTVKAVGYGEKSGNYVTIDHGDGVETTYLHMSGTDVKKGQSVAAGTPIGAVGSTGISSGSHLHFGVKKDGEWVNPEKYV